MSGSAFYCFLYLGFSVCFGTKCLGVRLGGVIADVWALVRSLRLKRMWSF